MTATRRPADTSSTLPVFLPPTTKTKTAKKNKTIKKTETAKPRPATFAAAEQTLATALDGYEPRPQQQALAAKVSGFYGYAPNFIALDSDDYDPLVPRTHFLGQGPCGCIQGDAEVIINRAGNGKRMSLKTLVSRFNGEPGRYQWDHSIPTYIQREADDGTVRLAQVKAAWHSGVKQTYTVTTETGRTIRATDEHPFRTERGWLRLDELVVGDEVHVRGGQASGRPRQPKILYVRVLRGMQHHPYANHWKNGVAMVPEHRLVVEAEMNQMTYDAFLARVASGGIGMLTFLDPKVWAVHHRDHDPQNNEYANLQVLTHSEHQRLHSHEGKTRSVLYKVVTERVTSVVEYGMEDTYDVEVDDDPHNFIVNGFVVHNSGKTFAYLIPAIASGKRTIVSVTTKSLQAQIIYKDLPFLAEHFDFTYSMLQGRGNYLCLNRAEAADTADVPFIADVIAYGLAHPEIEGLQGDLPFAFSYSQWSKVCGESEECSSNECSSTPERCFAVKAREIAQTTDITVVNHALLMTDLLITQVYGAPGMLGKHDAIILDECHEVSEVASNTFGTMFSEGTFFSLASQVRNWANRHTATELEDIQPTLTALNGPVSRFFAAAKPGRILESTIDPLLDTFEEVVAALQAVQSIVRSTRTTGSDDKGRKQKKRLERRISSTLTRFCSVVGDEWDVTVRWVEIDHTSNGPRKVLKLAPIDVAPVLRQHLFSRVPCVLVSATIAVNGQFEFICNQLGIDTYVSLAVESPFDFDTQARLYVPEHLPEPTGYQTGVWESVAIEEIVDLLRASDGRALVLFTSIKHMRAAYDIVSRRVSHRIKMQGQPGESVKGLADWFRKDVHGILFGTKSFMTGLDVMGSSCSLVIISKLPFPVPTEPITEARCEAIDKRGGRAFSEYTIPTMSLILQQAAGRLIRCFDMDTEVLTTQGWRRYDEMQEGMMVYGIPPESLTSNGKSGFRPSVHGAPLLTTHQVTAVKVNIDPEAMLAITAKSLNLRVTPDHTMVIQPSIVRRDMAGTKGGFYTWKGGDYLSTYAKDLPSRFKMPLAGRVVRRPSKLPRGWFWLIGFLLADGSLSRDKNLVTLHQSLSKPQVVEAVDTVLSQLGIKANRYVRSVKGTEMSVRGGKTYLRTEDMVWWQINGHDAARIKDVLYRGWRRRYSKKVSFNQQVHKGVAGWVEVEKMIPRWCLERASRQQLLALLEGLMAGDGNLAWVKEQKSGTFYTAISTEADSFQELLVLVGYRSSLARDPQSGQYEVGFTTRGSVDVTRSACVSVVEDAPSWCVSTELGSVVARRDGHTFIAGNSRNDTGVVAILDPRIVSKSYGKQILKDLPPMRYTKSIAEVQEFLTESAVS